MSRPIPDILIIGSSNTDMVIRTDRFPGPGETIIGGDFFMNPGGKGANQAVAAARLGGKVAFITKVGTDIFGRQTVQNLEKEGIDISALVIDPEHPSGVAQIIVDKNAENCIVVAPGANMSLSRKDIEKNPTMIELAEIILMQLEIPLSTIEYAARRAYVAGRKVILNPAPATHLPDELYKSLFLITPNESEAEFITGIHITGEKDALKAAEIFQSRGVRNVIITLGKAGAFVSTDEFKGIIPAPEVHAVDTTAAGDTFNGALAVGISQKMDIAGAVGFANRAAALSVTRMGAQSSIPNIHELQKHFL